MTTFRFVMAVLCLVLALTNPVLYADSEAAGTGQTDSLKTIQARGVVVSASRWAEEARDVPREITVITPLDISRKIPSTAADMIMNSGTVMVQKSQLGGGSPMIRGFATNAVLIVVDGVRMNNAIYRSGNLQNVIAIDANALDGAEVLFGPGSVQYGSDAMGGVMVFNTHQATLIDQGTYFGGKALLRYGSAANEVTGSATLDFSSRSIASSTVITYSKFGDLRSGSVFDSREPDFGKRTWYAERFGDRDSMVANSDVLRQVQSGYSQMNVTENLLFRITDDATVNYGGIFSTTTDVPRYDRLVELNNGLPKSAEWYYGPQLWTMHSLTYKTSDAGFFGSQAAVTASFQFNEESRNDRKFNKTDFRSQVEQVLIGSVNADVKASLDQSSPYTRELKYGLEWWMNEVSSEATLRDINTGEVRPTLSRYPDGGTTVNSVAGYVQVHWGLSSNLSIAGGIRTTYYSLEAAIIDTASFSIPYTSISLNPTSVTGSVGLTWQAADGITMHSNLANGFRAPNLDNFKVSDSSPGVVVVPDSNLKPEYATTLECGIQLDPSSALDVSVNGFYTWASDAIETRPALWNGMDSIDIYGERKAVFANTNIGTARIYGLDIRVSYAVMPELKVFATTTFVNGRETTNDIPLRHAAPTFATVSATWQPGTWWLSGSFWWSDGRELAELTPSEENKVGVQYSASGALPWQRVDLAAGWTVTKLLTLQLQVENVLDYHYRTYASGISAPGRNIIVSTRVNW